MKKLKCALLGAVFISFFSPHHQLYSVASGPFDRIKNTILGVGLVVATAAALPALSKKLTTLIIGHKLPETSGTTARIIELEKQRESAENTLEYYAKKNNVSLSDLDRTIKTIANEQNDVQVAYDRYLAACNDAQKIAQNIADTAWEYSEGYTGKLCSGIAIAAGGYTGNVFYNTVLAPYFTETSDALAAQLAAAQANNDTRTINALQEKILANTQHQHTPGWGSSIARGACIIGGAAGAYFLTAKYIKPALGIQSTPMPWSVQRAYNKDIAYHASLTNETAAAYDDYAKQTKVYQDAAAQVPGYIASSAEKIDAIDEELDKLRGGKIQAFCTLFNYIAQHIFSKK